MWTTAKLQDVCNIFSGNSVNAKEKEARYTHNSQGTPYVATKDVGFDGVIDYSNGVSIPLDFLDSFKTAPVGATLVCAEGGSAGRKIAITDREICFVNKLFALCPNQDLHQKYLLYYTMGESFQKQFKDGLSGLIGGVSLSKIKAFDISFPSLYEQQRIVAILDQAFADIEKARANAEKNLKNARELFDSYLNQVFSQRGEGWVEHKLGDVCSFENGDRGKNYPNRSEYVSEGVPWINTGHIEPNGTLSSETMNYITEEKFDELRSGKIQIGDLVYCLRGNTVGKAAMVNPLTRGAVASSLVIIRPSIRIEQKFLYYFLISPTGKERISLYANGAAQPNLGAKSVAKYKIHLPDTEVQKWSVSSIESNLFNLEKLELNYKNKLASLDELKKSLLQKAFSGELTKTEGHAA